MKTIRFRGRFIDTSGIYDSSREKYQSEINTEANTITTLILNASDWVADGTTFVQSKTVQGMTANSYPIWTYNGDPTADQYKEFCFINTLITSANTVTFRCTKKKPTLNIPIIIKGI